MVIEDCIDFFCNLGKCSGNSALDGKRDGKSAIAYGLLGKGLPGAVVCLPTAPRVQCFLNVKNVKYF